MSARHLRLRTAFVATLSVAALAVLAGCAPWGTSEGTVDDATGPGTAAEAEPVDCESSEYQWFTADADNAACLAVTFRPGQPDATTDGLPDLAVSDYGFLAFDVDSLDDSLPGSISVNVSGGEPMSLRLGLPDDAALGRAASDIMSHPAYQERSALMEHDDMEVENGDVLAFTLPDTDTTFLAQASYVSIDSGSKKLDWIAMYVEGQVGLFSDFDEAIAEVSTWLTVLASTHSRAPMNSDARNLP
ncbi:hypothetical protein [Salininema proteolyticum]|uniref:Lipoprotein n=1 Tax=Salininema proteolyticum TaxID=1607685 RepID=A0ABV8U4X7_9ACTN